MRALVINTGATLVVWWSCDTCGYCIETLAKSEPWLEGKTTHNIPGGSEIENGPLGDAVQGTVRLREGSWLSRLLREANTHVPRGSPLAIEIGDALVAARGRAGPRPSEKPRCQVCNGLVPKADGSGIQCNIPNCPQLRRDDGALVGRPEMWPEARRRR